MLLASSHAAAGFLSALHTPPACLSRPLMSAHPLSAAPRRAPSTGDVIIFRPARGVGRDSSFLDDNVFIKRIVAVAGAWAGLG